MRHLLPLKGSSLSFSHAFSVASSPPRKLGLATIRSAAGYYSLIESACCVEARTVYEHAAKQKLRQAAYISCRCCPSFQRCTERPKTRHVDNR